MPKVEKIGGLIMGAVFRISGLPFGPELSMLVEECASITKETRDSVKSIQAIAEGQVLGLMNAALIALDNAASDDLKVRRKFEEVRKALSKFETCYGQLMAIDLLSSHRGDVATCIGVCHVLLDNNRLAKKWFKTAVTDWETFGRAEITEPDLANRAAYRVTQASGAGGALLSIGILKTIAMAGVAVISLPVALATMAMGATGALTLLNVENNEEKRKRAVRELKASKQEALKAAKDLKATVINKM
jgi:hypothetical protein